MDANVDAHFGDQIRDYFAAHDADLHLLVLPMCEDNKNFDLVFTVAEEIEKVKLNRRKEPLIAIGGGVCLDVCGLAANLYRRNTPIIKVCFVKCSHQHMRKFRLLVLVSTVYWCNGQYCLHR